MRSHKGQRTSSLCGMGSRIDKAPTMSLAGGNEKVESVAKLPRVSETIHKSRSHSSDSTSLGQSILNFIESSVFGGSPSVSGHGGLDSDARAHPTAGEHGKQRHGAPRLLPVDDSTVIQAYPMSSVIEAEPADEPLATAKHPQSEKPAEAVAKHQRPKGARLEASLADQHPREAGRAVLTMAAEARALGYEVVPKRLFNEAKRLGQRLKPVTAAAKRELAYAQKEEAAVAAEKKEDKEKRALGRVEGDGAGKKAAALARVENIANGQSLAEIHQHVEHVPARHDADVKGGSLHKGVSLLKAGRESGPEADRKGGPKAAKGEPKVASAGASAVADEGGAPLSKSDSKRLAFEKEVEEANRRRLAAKKQKSMSLVRKQQDEARHRAASSAKSAMHRYGSIMSFHDNEADERDGKLDVEASQSGLADSQYGQRIQAQQLADKKLNKYSEMLSFSGHEGKPGEKVSEGEKRMLEEGKQQEFLGAERRGEGMADKKLDEYSRLLSFSGHEGKPGEKVSEGDKRMLEEGKQQEFLGAERRGEGMAEEQLHDYDVFQFNDGDIARKAAAKQRVARKQEHEAAVGGSRRGRTEMVQSSGEPGAGVNGAKGAASDAPTDGFHPRGEGAASDAPTDGFHPSGEGANAIGGHGYGPDIERGSSGGNVRLDKGQAMLRVQEKSTAVMDASGGASSESFAGLALP